ncbi:TetR family transcriptional regulator [Occultella glacieicola]|uniref:TetR family transcriptional regulator n=1 Tax=Occultella glacieicola TaxID=2518684 RepID=A0ABY2E1K9_9MICO|nr:TetR family transcriptional regulator [Occultella glacieicola]TDE89257.1 TetR family transcriptional regulator [Occultella glacieicola]
MARASKAQSEATERRLREVARELFAEHGYAAVGLERVAEAAGVTRGAVYHHFGDKLGLFAAVLADAHAGIGAAVADAAPGRGWQAIKDGSAAFLRAAVDPGIRRIVLVDGPAVIGWESWRRMDADHSAHLLAEGLAELDDLAVDPGAAGALLGGAMNEAAIWIADGGDPILAEAALNRMIDALRR